MKERLSFRLTEKVQGDQQPRSSLACFGTENFPLHVELETVSWNPAFEALFLKKKKKSYKKLQRELAQLVTVSKQTKARKAGQHKFSPENRGCKCPLAKRDSVDPKQEIWETEINFVKLLWFLISTLWRKFKQQGTFPSCPAFSHWGSIYFQWILLKLPPRLTDPTSHWCLFPHPIFLRNMKESSSPSADKERLQTWWASQN